MEKKKAGHPPKYKEPSDIDAKIQEYFDGIAEDDIPTTAGLALHLGFCDRRSLYDNRDRNEGFSHSIKKALLHIESYHEKNLQKNGCTGSIFWLKNHQWRDTQEQKHVDDDGKAIAPVINVTFKE